MTIYGQLSNRKDMSITQGKALEPVAEESVVDADEIRSTFSDIKSKK